jgi:hypothetical protein
MGEQESRPDIAPYEPVLTISASFGCGGSVITPLLADRFGLPFVDRPPRSWVAPSAGVPVPPSG